MSLKKSVSVGIGLFIALIGLSNAEVIIPGSGVLVALGDIRSGEPLLALIGIAVTGILLAKKIKGALFLGILITTVIGVPMGITKIPGAVISPPPSLSPTFAQFDFSYIFSLDMLIIIFTFLFVDLFDTVGTLVGVATKADMLEEGGKVPKAKQALLADAVATTVGAVLGTSTVTTYVESASGVAEGGRTGLTSLTTGVLFIIALLFSPIFIMIPSSATAPALVLVGLFMLSPIKDIPLDDFTESIPAFLAMIMMPLTYSISEGIIFGILSYVVIKLLSGKAKDISLLMYFVAVLFLIKIYIG
jgi:AGZA family xanthine/uracil permease-like MFS transporter